MIFQENHTTRWHDTDAFRRVTPTQMLVYMQEASNHHMDSVGMPLDTLRDEKRLAFILSKMRLAIYAPLYAYEDIEVQTWTCPSRGFASNRDFRILRGNEVIAEAESIWALVDLANGKLCRGDAAEYAFEDEAPLALPLPSRFRFPEGAEPAVIGTRRIVYSDLDYNGHMNNTHYPDMLCDFLPTEVHGNVRGMTLSYLHEAALGDTITLLGVQHDDTYYIRTHNESGKVCLEAQILV